MARIRQPVVLLDTHIVVWLYAGLLEKLTEHAKQAINASEVFVSPMVKLELQYLYEIGRITVVPDAILGTLTNAIGLKVWETPLTRLIDEAVKVDWTRDVFDRILAADATVNGFAFITADEKIRSNLELAVW